MPETLSIIFNRPELQYALGLANDIVRARSPKPVLQCVKLEAGDTVKLYATDLERSICVELRQVQSETAGSVCVPCDKLFRVIQACSGDTVKLRVDGEVLVIAAGDSEWKIGTMPTTQFPPIGFECDGDGIVVEGKKLAKAIRLARACVNTEAIGNATSARNAVFMACEGAEVQVCGSDGSALGFSRMAGTGTASWSGMLSHATVSPIEKMCEADNVRMSLSPNQAFFSAEDIVYVAALMEGTYFAYQEMLERREESIMSINREALMDAVSSVSVVIDEITRRMVWDISPSRLAISTSNQADAATASVDCRCDANLKIALRPNYLTSVLKIIEDETISVGIKTAMTPIVIRLDGHVFIQMPLHLQE